MLVGFGLGNRQGAGVAASGECHVGAGPLTPTVNASDQCLAHFWATTVLCRGELLTENTVRNPACRSSASISRSQ